LDIEKHDVGFVFVDGRQSFDAVAGLSDDRQIPDLVELVAELFAGEALIVHDENSQGITHQGSRLNAQCRTRPMTRVVSLGP
jgi:hypothetical protein